MGELFGPLIASTFGCSTDLLVIQNLKLGAFSTRNSARNSERRGDIFDTSLKLKKIFTEHVENPWLAARLLLLAQDFQELKSHPRTSLPTQAEFLVGRFKGIATLRYVGFLRFHRPNQQCWWWSWWWWISPHFPSGLIQKAVVKILPALSKAHSSKFAMERQTKSV